MGKPLALITGASGGIGEALAYAFADAGYDLALVARSEAKLADVAKSLEARGAKASLFPQDLQAEGAGQALESAVERSGLKVEVLVNNAGYGYAGAFLDGDRDEQLGEIDLNVRILTGLTHRFLNRMRARGRGGVLNVASTAAFQPGPFMAVYYASKAYVLSFTEALNYELRGSGLHATALCPGPVLTGFQARAGFDESMAILKLMPALPAEAVARAGVKGFLAKRPVVIPGLSNFIAAKSVALTPRPLLLAMVERLQRKRNASRV